MFNCCKWFYNIKKIKDKSAVFFFEAFDGGTDGESGDSSSIARSYEPSMLVPGCTSEWVHIFINQIRNPNSLGKKCWLSQLILTHCVYGHTTPFLSLSLSGTSII